MHVNLIMRLWNVQKVCYTLMQSYTLWTSCLFGLFSDDWLWCFSTLLTAGNCSNGTCFSYDKDPESSSNMCLPIISAVQKKKKPKKTPQHSPSKWIAHWSSELCWSTTRQALNDLWRPSEIINPRTPSSGMLWARSGWQISHFHNIRCYGNSF